MAVFLEPSRGHTDAQGSDAYKLEALRKARALTVRNWLARRAVVPATTPIKGFGKSRPVAPNSTADGKDDPLGRQKTGGLRSYSTAASEDSYQISRCAAAITIPVTDANMHENSTASMISLVIVYSPEGPWRRLV
jgi:hypothetical protein